MESNHLTVKFYDSASDDLLRFAVIAARYQGQWVFCKHRQRNTYEIAGGHREAGEKIAVTAKRELYEETGAKDFEIRPVCVYSVTGKNRVNESGGETYGMLYFAQITRFEKLPQSEIEKVVLLKELPQNWTYPEIQPKLIEKVRTAAGIM